MKKIFIEDEKIHAVEHHILTVPPEGISIYSNNTFQDILIVCKDDLLLNWAVNHGEDFKEGLLYQARDNMKEIGDIKVNVFSVKPIEKKEATLYFTVQRN